MHKWNVLKKNSTGFLKPGSGSNQHANHNPGSRCIW